MRHASTALLNCVLDENDAPEVVVVVVVVVVMVVAIVVVVVVAVVVVVVVMAVVVAVVVVHTFLDIDPEEPSNMSVLVASDRTQASPQRFCLNDAACKNI